MSIKTFPDRGPEHFVPFLLLSFILHMVLAATLSYWGPVPDLLFKRLTPQPREPVVVDVVELPPGPSREPVRKDTRIFSERSSSVEKETVPDTERPQLKGTVEGPPAAVTVVPGQGAVVTERGAEPPKEKPLPSKIKTPSPAPIEHKERAVPSVETPALKGPDIEERPPLKEETAEQAPHAEVQKTLEEAEPPVMERALEKERPPEEDREKTAPTVSETVEQEQPSPPRLIIERPVTADRGLEPWEEALKQEEPPAAKDIKKVPEPVEEPGIEEPAPPVAEPTILSRKMEEETVEKPPIPAEEKPAVMEKREITEAPLIEKPEPIEVLPGAVEKAPSVAHEVPEPTVEDKMQALTPGEPEIPEVEEPAPPVVTPAPAEKGRKKRRPDLFLSDERIAQLVEEYEKAPPEKERGKRLQLNTSELRFAKYMLDVKRKIYLKWEYPPVAIRNRQQGKLRINFKIRRDGKLIEAKLIKSSNFPVLDDAALTALRLADFSPFPENIEVESIEIHATFEYVIHQIGPR